MFRDFYGSEIGCVLVTIPVHGRYKTVVVHGHNEGEFAYGGSKSESISKLKEQILSKSDYKHYTWMEVPGPEDVIYVLLADGDGTLRSIDTPFGAAVTTKEEAERYVKEGGVGFTHSYTAVRIFDNKDKAIKRAFSSRG